MKTFSLQTVTIIILTVCGFQSTAQTLIGSWNFNGNANDASGNGLNGTVYNATLTPGQGGIPNTAYQFNGTNSHIDVPYSSLLNLSNWTVQTIIRIDGFNQNTCQAEFIMSRSAQATNDYMMVGINDNAHDNSCTTFSPNNTEFIPGAAGSASSNWHDANYIQLGTWYCHTVTYNGTVLKTFLNGTLIDSEVWSNQYNFSNTGVSQPQLIFGYYPAGGVTFPYWLNGAIDNLTIWNGAMSDSAVAASCNTQMVTTNNIALVQPYIDTNQCTGATLSLAYTKTGSFSSGNIFTAQLSNANGNFSNPTNIGNVVSTSGGIISCTIPSGTISGSGYRVRVISSLPSDTSNNNGVNIHLGNLPASIVTNNSPLCPGDTIKIVATNANNVAAFAWTGPSGFISSSQNVTIPNCNIGNEGWYHLNTSLSGCIRVDSVDVTFTPGGTPPIVSITTTTPESVCPGTHGTFTVTATNAGANPQYLWYVNGGFQPGLSTIYAPTLGFVDSETIICKVVNATSQCVLTDTGISNTIKIHVYNISTPVAKVSSYPAVYTTGTTVTFSAQVVGGGPTYVFQWLKNGVIIPGANTSTYITKDVSENDKMLVKVLSVGPCAIDSTSSNVINVGITNTAQANDELTIRPNPNNGKFILEGKIENSSTAIHIFNATGTKVYDQLLKSNNLYLNELISIDNLARGVYYLLVIGTHTYTIKFIIN